MNEHYYCTLMSKSYNWNSPIELNVKDEDEAKAAAQKYANENPNIGYKVFKKVGNRTTML